VAPRLWRLIINQLAYGGGSNGWQRRFTGAQQWQRSVWRMWFVADLSSMTKAKKKKRKKVA